MFSSFHMVSSFTQSETLFLYYCLKLLCCLCLILRNEFPHCRFPIILYFCFSQKRWGNQLQLLNNITCWYCLLSSILAVYVTFLFTERLKWFFNLFLSVRKAVFVRNFSRLGSSATRSFHSPVYLSGMASAMPRAPQLSRPRSPFCVSTSYSRQLPPVLPPTTFVLNKDPSNFIPTVL